jgi:hypothetical protein
MSKGRQKTGEPSPEDRRKAELLEEFRRMIPELKRPGMNRVMLASDPQWSFKTRSFLLGVSDDDRPWEQQTWLAATDVCGCGTPAEEVLDLFVTACRAWGDAEKTDKIMRVIANAYSKPRRPHRDFRGEHRNVPHRSPGAGAHPRGSLWPDQQRGTGLVGPDTAAVPGPGKVPPSMASEPDDYSV